MEMRLLYKRYNAFESKYSRHIQSANGKQSENESRSQRINTNSPSTTSAMLVLMQLTKLPQRLCGGITSTSGTERYRYCPPIVHKCTAKSIFRISFRQYINWCNSKTEHFRFLKKLYPWDAFKRTQCLGVRLYKSKEKAAICGANIYDMLRLH